MGEVFRSRSGYRVIEDEARLFTLVIRTDEHDGVWTANCARGEHYEFVKSITQGRLTYHACGDWAFTDNRSLYELVRQCMKERKSRCRRIHEVTINPGSASRSELEQIKRALSNE